MCRGTLIVLLCINRASSCSCQSLICCLSFLQLNRRVLCITLLLGLSNDEDKNVKVNNGQFWSGFHFRVTTIKTREEEPAFSHVSLQ